MTEPRLDQPGLSHVLNGRRRRKDPLENPNQNQPLDETGLNHWVERKPKSHLKGIGGQTEAIRGRVIRTLPGKRNVE
ncbi:hypothetical protein BHM03_00040449 [Ensete ventricosum]|nr:hypothetical protein BHM03_00040449 [Ensete ventricosum]